MDSTIWTAFFAIALGSSAGGVFTYIHKERKRWQQKSEQLLEQERSCSEHLCLSTIEALTTAFEANDPYNPGYLEGVEQGVLGIAHSLKLSEEETTFLHAASLLHNIGRMGIPAHILQKTEALTTEEQEKLRTHPVLGARILATVPFPWPIVPIIRHQAERWDGNGYPDGLKGSDIPLAARILAVASTYSALLRPRPYRAAMSPEEALAEIEANSGTQFDPAIVAAFRPVAVRLRANAEEAVGEMEGETASKSRSSSRKSAASATRAEKRAVQEAIVAAQQEAHLHLHQSQALQQETMGLFKLTGALAESLHLESVSNALIQGVLEIVPCSACVLFLQEEDDSETLYAHAASGVNERFLLGSVARVGTYLTGRAFSRGEVKTASFLPDDLTLRDVSGEWVPFRSTLSIPLMNHGQPVGVLNLYSEEEDHFGAEAHRLMKLIAVQSGRALDNALRFASAQETAYTDGLTGLKNARYLREYLEREVNRSNREGLPLAVLNIDVDHFKKVNDTMGHARGDQTLRDVAEILNSHVRNYDLVVRYAGDEFLIVLSRAGRVGAETVASKLRNAMERHIQRIIAREPEFPPIGLSIGIALYPEDGLDVQSLLCRSDAAMYADKQAHHGHRDELAA